MTNPTKTVRAEDQALVDRCLLHDEDAWDEFVQRFRRLLCHGLAHRFKRVFGRVDEHTVEDLAQDILLSLCSNDRKLRKFVAGRGGLGTYLLLLVRHHFTAYVETQAARRWLTAEPLAAEPVLEHAAASEEPLLEWNEFLEGLPAADRRYCEQYLMGLRGDQPDLNWPSWKRWRAEQRVWHQWRLQEQALE